MVVAGVKRRLRTKSACKPEPAAASNVEPPAALTDAASSSTRRTRATPKKQPRRASSNAALSSDGVSALVDIEAETAVQTLRTVRVNFSYTDFESSTGRERQTMIREWKTLADNAHKIWQKLAVSTSAVSRQSAAHLKDMINAVNSICGFLRDFVGKLKTASFSSLRKAWDDVHKYQAPHHKLAGRLLVKCAEMYAADGNVDDACALLSEGAEHGTLWACVPDTERKHECRSHMLVKLFQKLFPPKPEGDSEAARSAKT